MERRSKLLIFATVFVIIFGLGLVFGDSAENHGRDIECGIIVAVGGIVMLALAIFYPVVVLMLSVLFGTLFAMLFVASAQGFWDFVFNYFWVLIPLVFSLYLTKGYYLDGGRTLTKISTYGLILGLGIIGILLIGGAISYAMGYGGYTWQQAAFSVVLCLLLSATSFIFLYYLVRDVMNIEVGEPEYE